ncbi:MAG: leucine-rich repeat protein [Acetatifactor sp.]|nr:leucine-rich repeat protein [Acetatifactor sp.]
MGNFKKIIAIGSITIICAIGANLTAMAAENYADLETMEITDNDIPEQTRQSVQTDASENDIEELYEYRVQEDGSIAITKYKGTAADVVIPEQIDGMQVTSIGPLAFNGNTKLVSVEIPKGVLYLDGFSECTNLKSVKMSEGVIAIDGAFFNCVNLSDIVLPESLEHIGSYTFYGCKSIGTLTIPKNVSYIGGSAFTSTGIKLDITIGANNYELVKSLKDVITNYNVTILDDVTSIEADSFKSCNCLRSVSIPNSVTSIGNDAFHGCSGMKEISIPESVTEIGENAFMYCDILSKVTIPQNVVSIGGYAFANCRDLEEVNILGKIDKIEKGMFSKDKNLTVIHMPDTVTSIEEDAFSYCSSLSDIVIPNAVTSIGDYAFYSTSLSNVQLPESLISIGKYAYGNCRNFTDLSIPNGVTSIGECAFQDCRSLENVSIPISVTQIGSNAFDVCHENLIIDISVNEKNWKQVKWLGGKQNVFISDEVTAIGDRTFYGCGGIVSVVIPESVTRIQSSAFSSCSSLVNVTLPKSVKALEDGVFSGCSSLTSIELPDSLEDIGNSAFSGCSSLKNIELPDKLNYIGYNAFSDCISLTEISIPDGVVYLYGSTFSGCTNLSEVVLHENISFIDSAVFKDCTSLTSITIPAKVSKIGRSTFSGCTNLSEVVLDENILFIDSSAFKDCKSLTSITIPAKVSVIDESTFEGCSALENVVLSGKITSIGNNAFLNCSELKEIKLAIPLSEIGAHAFNGCVKLNKVIVPSTVQKIDTYAFANCSNLSEIYILNPECEIYDFAMTISDTATIYGTNNSTAHIYAQNNDRKFVAYVCSHEWTVEDGIEPTCTEAGKTEKKWCSVCSEILQESVEIPALGHAEVIDNRIEPTCTEEGMTEGLHCSRCNLVFLKQRVIPAAGHREVIDQAVAPTYTEEGKTQGSHCSVCHIVIKAQEEIPKLKHKIIFDSRCETSIPEQAISEGEKVQEPTAIFKDGYVFTGWYTSLYKQDDSTKWDFENDIVIRNMTLYAGWDFVQDWNGHPINAEDVIVSFQNASSANMTYTGSFIKPAVSVKYVYNGKKTTLKENADYILEYKNNLEVGTATVKIYGTGEYSGSREITFTINPKNISKVKVAALPEFRVSGGLVGEVGNSMNVVDGTKLLVYGEDFDISISQKDVNTKTKIAVTIIGKGNYTGTKSNGVTFMLSPANSGAINIAEYCNASLAKNTEYTFTGNAIKPQVLVTRNGKKLSSKDYKVVYKDNIETGIGYAVVYGCNEYCGTITVPFTITPKAINKCKLQVKNTTLYYNGREQNNLSFIVKDGKRILKPGIDYSVTYVGDFKNITGKVKPYIEIHAIEGGNYTEGTKTLTKTFKIAKGRLNSTASINAELIGEGVTYDSVTKTYRVPAGVEPQVVVTYNGEVLSGSKFVNKMDKTGLSYTYKLPNIKACKKSTIKVTGANDFTGNISIKCIGY